MIWASVRWPPVNPGVLNSSTLPTWQGVANNQSPGSLKAQLEDLTWDGSEFLTAGTHAPSSDALTWTVVQSDTKFEFLTFDDGMYVGPHRILIPPPKCA